MTRRAKALNLLVGPMRPIVAGGAYDPGFHTFELLREAGLGVDVSDLTLANMATFVPTLQPMNYDEGAEFLADIVRQVDERRAADEQRAAAASKPRRRRRRQTT